MVRQHVWITIVMLIGFSHFAHISGKETKRCYLDRVHKMIAYNCANLKLTDIPKYLKTSIEILDASENRIRKLNQKSFALYHDLKFLYLFDNMILKIEVGTFSQLPLLETLDLSQNGLRFVPPEIFALPNLRNLYLADNEIKNEAFNSIVKPVKAPLIYLNLASTEIDKVPDLGILPELLHLNLSMNAFKHLAPEQFAPLCQLKEVDLNKTNIEACQCHKINFFIENELQRLPILTCSAIPSNCNLDPNATYVETKDFLRCLNVKEELIKTKSATVLPWQLIAFCSVIGSLFLVMIYVHCMQKPPNRPQQIELLSEINLQVNPQSKSTLIM